MHEGGLPSAVLPEHRVELPRGEGEVDAADGVDATILFLDAAQLKNRCHGNPAIASESRWMVMEAPGKVELGGDFLS